MLGVQSVAFTRACSTCSTSTLFGGGLRNGCHDEGIHTEFGVVHFDLRETRVDDVVDSIDSDGCFSDVGGYDHLTSSWRCWFEDLLLHFGGECRVDRQDDQFRGIIAQFFHAIVEDLTSSIDFFLTGEEEENIPCWFIEMDLHDTDECCFEVITFRFLREEHLHRKVSTGDTEDLTIEEVLSEFLGIKRRRCNDQCEIVAFRYNLLQQTE